MTKKLENTTMTTLEDRVAQLELQVDACTKNIIPPSRESSATTIKQFFPDLLLSHEQLVALLTLRGVRKTHYYEASIELGMPVLTPHFDNKATRKVLYEFQAVPDHLLPKAMAEIDRAIAELD